MESDSKKSVYASHSREPVIPPGFSRLPSLDRDPGPGAEDRRAAEVNYVRGKTCFFKDYLGHCQFRGI